MSKLITAKEAVALSNSETNIDKHINYINQQIHYACQYHEHHVGCDLWDCTSHTVTAIAARLRAAGYRFEWYLLDVANDRVWFEISWGGS
jgi:hypothetical protein